MHKSTKQFAL